MNRSTIAPGPTTLATPCPQWCPPLDSTEAVNAEIRWVAREAMDLRGDPDPERRARFMERKNALLEVVESGR